jgi:hypothetical protein
MKTPLTGTVESRAPDSNQEWQAWGGKDPRFGVIPQPGRERNGATLWTDADFYQTGGSDWEEFMRRNGVELGSYHRFRLSRRQWSPFMQSVTYDAGWVHETLSFLGFQDVETCSFQRSRGGAVYSWVFARKALQA